MKFLSILAAASLALAPVFASADSHEDSNDDKSLTPGGVAGRDGVTVGAGIPVEGAAVGALLLIGAVGVALIGGDGSNNNTSVTTTNGTGTN